MKVIFAKSEETDRRNMKPTFTNNLLTAFLILLFAYTGTSKILAFQNFQNVLSQAPYIAPLSFPIAVGVPLMELFCCVLLVQSKWRVTGMYFSFFLLLSFTLYLMGMKLSGSKLPCSCGGVLQQLSWKDHIALNTGFLLLTAYALKINTKTITIPSPAT